jgi:tRNA pseudouridine32 synthase/23S rRNA pseudouridine746 synthase
MKVDPEGQPSTSRWRVRGRGFDAAGKPIAWLELSPLTGRTHQLRVHCAALNFPIHGDPIYGSGAGTLHGPLHLHSRAIVVPISKNTAPVEAEACIPAHMRALLAACGWTPALDDAVLAARRANEEAQRQKASGPEHGGIE